MSPKIVLTYLNLPGRGEIIRLVLSAGNLDFEDKRVTREEWKDLKQSTPMGQLPILEYDGVVLAQSCAIAKFLAKKTNLAPKSDLDEARADMIIDFIKDGQVRIAMAWHRTGEERVEAAKKLFTVDMPEFFKIAERLLKQNGGKYFAGDSLSYADIGMFDQLEAINWPDHPFMKDLPHQEERLKIIDQHPLLAEFLDRVRQNPGIKNWLEKRPVFKGL